MNSKSTIHVILHFKTIQANLLNNLVKNRTINSLRRLDNCNEVLDLSTKPASVRQHIGVSEATLALGHAPLSQTPFRKTTPPNRPVTPHFHMAPYMATRPHRPPVAGYDIGATNSGTSCTNSGTSYTNSGNSCTDSSSGSTCRAKASDGVISSSSRDSHEWQKYVTGSRYSPVSGYGSATGSGSGNSTSNSPFSSARSSPCREMMADARPVVNWTHLEKVKLMQEVRCFIIYGSIILYINIYVM